MVSLQETRPFDKDDSFYHKILMNDINSNIYFSTINAPSVTLVAKIFVNPKLVQTKADFVFKYQQ